MKIKLKKITPENIWNVVKLQVKDDQKKFIASNTASILEAYATQNIGNKVETFAIYNNYQLIGFFMIDFDIWNWEGAPKVARNNYCLWRFMIDKHFQNKGLGKQSLKEIISYVKTKPLGNGNKIYLLCVQSNVHAIRLFEELGFKPNGEKDGSEIVLTLEL